METYRCNRNCGCMRCRYRGLMGPVMLLTVGVLKLLENVGPGNFNFWDRTWPLVLIAIGVMIMLHRTASTDGHVQPYGTVPPFPMTPASSPVSDSQIAIVPTEVPHE